MARPQVFGRLLVGAAGFEPTTLSSRTIRATKLRHAPTGCPLSQGERMIADAPTRTTVQASSSDDEETRRAGSRIGTTASAARTNEIAISQNTSGSPAWSPRTSMSAP